MLCSQRRHPAVLQVGMRRLISCVIRLNSSARPMRTYLPVQTICFSRRRREPMFQHNWDLGPDLGSNVRPLRTWAKCDRLGRVRLERRSKKCHGLDMSIKHDLQENGLWQSERDNEKLNFTSTDLILFTRQVAQFQAPIDTCVSLARYCRL